VQSVTFKGTTVTRDGLLKAMRDFDAAYPDTNEYENWLDKRSYKYAIRYGGKLYPCKHILSQASGISVREFSGGDQTNSVFRHLGFEVGMK
jgi:hypothetical protein